MNFISNRIEIKDLSKINNNDHLVIDSFRLILVYGENSVITLGSRVYKLNFGSVVVALPNEFCYIKEQEKVLAYSFKTDFNLPGGASVLEEQSLTVFSSILSLNDSAILFPYIELLLNFYNSSTAITPENSRNIERFADAVDILNQKVLGQISVPDLAERLGISLAQVKRLFSEFCGVGAHDYFNLIKIVKAKEFLVSGHSVTTTAELTGFANQAYFSAAFKRIAGVSPKEFSMEKQNGGSPAKRVNAKKPQKKSEQPTVRQELPSYLL